VAFEFDELLLPLLLCRLDPVVEKRRWRRAQTTAAARYIFFRRRRPKGVQPVDFFLTACVPFQIILPGKILQCEGWALASTSPSRISLNFGPWRPRRRLHLRLEVRHHLGKKG
jgi:hypothetical protein